LIASEFYNIYRIISSTFGCNCDSNWALAKNWQLLIKPHIHTIDNN
jgi:hypothetical protein